MTNQNTAPYLILSPGLPGLPKMFTLPKVQYDDPPYVVLAQLGAYCERVAMTTMRGRLSERDSDHP